MILALETRFKQGYLDLNRDISHFQEVSYFYSITLRNIWIIYLNESHDCKLRNLQLFTQTTIRCVQCRGCEILGFLIFNSAT